jgi:hypothetical protein
MLVKLNKKPIHVTDNDDQKGIDWIYLGCSCIGYLLILCLLDYVSYTFFFRHIHPFLGWLTNLL